MLCNKYRQKCFCKFKYEILSINKKYTNGPGATSFTRVTLINNKDIYPYSNNFVK